MTGKLLAIDQGTTSARSVLFDASGALLGSSQVELPQIYPKPGWVEHDPELIFEQAVATAQATLKKCGVSAKDIAAMGITNQRETTLLWDRKSGKPVHNAIVWQDRRSAALCDTLRQDGHEKMVAQKTGLLFDPYFSASKIAWMLDSPDASIDGLRGRAEAGEILFGTIDSYLLWRFTDGQVHATDATNASRTLLFNIHTQDWDDDLLALFNVPRALLPDVRDSATHFGTTSAALFGGEITIGGIAGDQQAAAFGQACFETGQVKSTYGTGCFALINTGKTALASTNKLLTTIAYRLGGKPTYALEGSIFMAGAAVQWLRDGLGIIANAAASEEMAKAAHPESSVVMVPAFAGLGAPYWDSGARGALFGLTRDTGPAEIVRATLDAVCFQTRDLFEAMAADGCAAPSAIRVDGGMVVNDWLMQRLADLVGAPVERPHIIETTALGAAMLAALQAGLCESPQSLSKNWRCQKRYEPRLDTTQRDQLYLAWQDAVSRTRGNQEK
ncbi:MAG: glycerol kinase GlpK [Proteobacteria bacterium]|nr:glycerol kinase GlpK [Pseudomonadota bacterium]